MKIKNSIQTRMSQRESVQCIAEKAGYVPRNKRYNICMIKKRKTEQQKTGGSMKRAFSLFIFMCCSLFLIISGCASVPVTGRSQLALVPESQLISLSADNYNELIKKTELADDPSQIAMLNEVGEKIADAADRFLRDNGLSHETGHYKWEYHLLKGDEKVNAFCMAGGKIGVYTGMMPVARDEAGLAVVLGHEVAHALAHHNRERVSHLLVAQLGGITLSKALEENNEKTRNLALIAYGIGSQVGYILPYSRLQESEADRIGLIITAMAGYDPRESIGLWQRMKAQGGANPPEFLSTHPAPETRIDHIRELIPEAMEYYRGDGVE